MMMMMMIMMTMIAVIGRGSSDRGEVVVEGIKEIGVRE